MGSYKQIFYQIVFGTKHWQPTLNETHCTDLYKYIWGIVKEKHSKLYQVNGVEDHIHIFCDLHPTVALADLVKAIKVGTSLWMKDSGKFPKFVGWQDGYGAFTYNLREKEKLIQYVRNQKEHHKKESGRDEFKRLLIENGIDFEEQYLF